MEIADDGSVITYSGPAQYTDAGAMPFSPRLVPAIAAGRAAPPEVAQAIAASAARHGVSPALVEAVAWQESRFRQAAVSPKGARGVMQLMPTTARELSADAFDMASNVDGGAAYLARMLRMFGGDTSRALAAYNAGPGAVARFGGVPPYAETRAYVQNILAHLSRVKP
jgi:soluble lytic murein transglycosylase-like protein